MAASVSSPKTLGNIARICTTRFLDLRKIFFNMHKTFFNGFPSSNLLLSPTILQHWQIEYYAAKTESLVAEFCPCEIHFLNSGLSRRWWIEINHLPLMTLPTHCYLITRLDRANKWLNKHLLWPVARNNLQLFSERNREGSIVCIGEERHIRWM